MIFVLISLKINFIRNMAKVTLVQSKLGNFKKKHILFFNISKSALFVEPDRVQVTNIIFMSVFGSNMSSAYLFQKQKFYK